MTKTVLITGANRGIGLEFAKQYASDGWRVHACCRTPDKADQLTESLRNKDASIHKLDVTDQASINALSQILSGEPIDILLNNAGIMGGEVQSFGNINYDDWETTLRTNTIAPLRVFEAFHDNVLAGSDKKVITISSKMGSIKNYVRGDQYIYRTSKTAVNMVMVNLDYEFRSQGICFLGFHPGWVQTDMGGAAADLTPHDSAEQLRHSIAAATIEQSGLLLDYNGSVIEW